MQVYSRQFKKNAAKALTDKELQKALSKVPLGFVERRSIARDKLPEFDALRDQARDIKNHTLAHLDLYLEIWERNLIAAGGHVHWCQTPAEARQVILDICQSHEAQSVTKGKSMITEEIGINHALEAVGIEAVETDLGEYIIQLRGETPSHIIAPAVHVTKAQIEKNFRQAHHDLPEERNLDSAASLVDEARQILRQKYVDADIGITGANYLIAETGSTVIVTNEGNGDLTQSLSKVNIVMATIEKVVPTLEDATTMLRLLARSATGQEFSSYTTFFTGPKRPGDLDGPDEFHVVVLDNGRTGMLGTEFQDMLRCIKCGACMNHCPVYQAVGGHSYGWVYPGPMGSVLTPAIVGIKQAALLPNASTFCGRCEEVCPMRIPLPKMLRHWREVEYERQLTPATTRYGLGIWKFFATRPKLYHLLNRIIGRVLRGLAGHHGFISNLPFATAWTKYREFPAPEGRTFMQQWKSGRRE